MSKFFFTDAVVRMLLLENTSGNFSRGRDLKRNDAAIPYSLESVSK